MRKLVVTGKTVEEAVRLGLQQLGVPREQVKVQVLEEPVRRFMGLFRVRKAKVELSVLADPIEEARRYLQEIIRHFGFPVEIEEYQKRDGVRFHLVGDNVGVYIGRRGETLDAIQYLLQLVANRYSDRYLHLELDAQNYRRRRREALQRLALRMAEQAVHKKKPISLEPMSAAERKVIHTALQNHDKVYTVSEGTGHERHVVIRPKM